MEIGLLAVPVAGTGMERFAPTGSSCSCRTAASYLSCINSSVTKAKLQALCDTVRAGCESLLLDCATQTCTDHQEDTAAVLSKPTSLTGILLVVGVCLSWLLFHHIQRNCQDRETCSACFRIMDFADRHNLLVFMGRAGIQLIVFTFLYNNGSIQSLLVLAYIFCCLGTGLRLVWIHAGRVLCQTGEYPTTLTPENVYQNVRDPSNKFFVMFAIQFGLYVLFNHGIVAASGVEPAFKKALWSDPSSADLFNEHYAQLIAYFVFASLASIVYQPFVHSFIKDELDFWYRLRESHGDHEAFR